MNTIQIAKQVAVNVALAAPSVLVTSSEPDAVRLLQMMNEAGREVARRADWRALEKTHTVIGTGSNDAFPLPADFDRLAVGNAVSFGGSSVRGSLTRDEWLSLPHAVGAPRYFRLLAGGISFFPHPDIGESVDIAYQSLYWCGGGESFNSDSDEPLVPADLVVSGAIWRWKRSNGLDYQDFIAEFEALLAQMAAFDQRDRTP